MTTSSEDVLMQVGQVRYKKGDGTLYVMNERIAFMLEKSNKVSVSHKYADIKREFYLFTYFYVLVLISYCIYFFPFFVIAFTFY